MRTTVLIIGVGVVAISGGIIWKVATSSRDNQISSTNTAISSPTLLNNTSIIRLISSSDAQNLITEKQNDPQFVILDVRTADEFTSGHLHGALNLDYYAADVNSKIAQLDKSKIYLVYCRTGHRSGEFIKLMQPLGFSSIYDLSGGITAWTVANLPLE